jgi:hypothetical protein
MDGGYGLCPLRLYGLSHYTALARELMFRNESRRRCRPWRVRQPPSLMFFMSL